MKMAGKWKERWSVRTEEIQLLGILNLCFLFSPEVRRKQVVFTKPCLGFASECFSSSIFICSEHTKYKRELHELVLSQVKNQRDNKKEGGGVGVGIGGC